ADRDDDGRDGQLDGRREGPADHVHHRLAGADRVAEVAGHHVLEEPAVLDPDRLVVAEGPGQQLAGRRGRALAERRVDRPAGPAGRARSARPAATWWRGRG